MSGVDLSSHDLKSRNNYDVLRQSFSGVLMLQIAIRAICSPL